MMERLPKGTKALIKATIIGDCQDERPRKDCGYYVATSRGKVMVEPHDIFVLASHVIDLSSATDMRREENKNE